MSEEQIKIWKQVEAKGLEKLAETTGLTTGELDRHFTTLLAEKKVRSGGSCLAEWKRIWKNKKNKQ